MYTVWPGCDIIKQRLLFRFNMKCFCADWTFHSKDHWWLNNRNCLYNIWHDISRTDWLSQVKMCLINDDKTSSELHGLKNHNNIPAVFKSRVLNSDAQMWNLASNVIWVGRNATMLTRGGCLLIGCLCGVKDAEVKKHQNKPVKYFTKDYSTQLCFHTAKREMLASFRFYF